jgi:hypothetical protein
MMLRITWGNMVDMILKSFPQIPKVYHCVASWYDEPLMPLDNGYVHQSCKYIFAWADEGVARGVIIKEGQFESIIREHFDFPSDAHWQDEDHDPEELMSNDLILTITW